MKTDKMTGTPETDAKASPHIGFFSCATVPAEFARKLERERDEAFELLASEKTTRNHIIKRSVEVEKERDEAKAALMRIEDLFLDGTDIYADRENMGMIAREALESTK